MSRSSEGWSIREVKAMPFHVIKNGTLVAGSKTREGAERLARAIENAVVVVKGGK